MASLDSRRRTALMRIALTAKEFNRDMFSDTEWNEFFSLRIEEAGYVEPAYPGGLTIFTWRITQKGLDFINAA